MKLNIPKSWYEKHIETEGDMEIGAGIPPWCKPKRRIPRLYLFSAALCLGGLIGVLRLQRGRLGWLWAGVSCIGAALACWCDAQGIGRNIQAAERTSENEGREL